MVASIHPRCRPPTDDDNKGGGTKAEEEDEDLTIKISRNDNNGVETRSKSIIILLFATTIKHTCTYTKTGGLTTWSRTKQTTDEDDG